MVNETQDEIIAACSWRWHEMPSSLPVIWQEDEGDTLTRNGGEGLKRRLTTLEFGWKPPAEQYQAFYINRLRYELRLRKAGIFAAASLMVENLPSWARKRDIPVGPGRRIVRRFTLLRGRWDHQHRPATPRFSCLSV